MPLLFAYGTLQEKDVQLSTFRRLLQGQKDELPGFEPSLVRIEDPRVVAASGKTHHDNVTFNGRSDSRVGGTVFEITEAELAAADRYEQVAAYTRVAAMLASGKQAWVYVDARFKSGDRAMSEMATTTNADRNFILQQGLEPPALESCALVTSALLFQARLVGLMLVAGTIMQSPAVFAVLAALLWWSALLPRLNPFDFLYNHTLGPRSGAPALGQAPMPRRFAQGMAAMFATASAATLAAGFYVAAWVFQAFFLLAVATLLFGKFCLGSFIYHLVRGRVAFAIGTLPWSRGA